MIHLVTQSRSWSTIAFLAITTLLASFLPGQERALRVIVGSEAARPQLLVVGGRLGNPAFLLAGTTLSRPVDGTEQVRPDIVVPLGRFDARGVASLRAATLATSPKRSKIWLQVVSTHGTSSPFRLSAALLAMQPAIQAPHPGELCRTQQQYRKGLKKSEAEPLACPLQGPCDDPIIRNGHLVSPIKTVRLSIHVFCHSNGSNCAATPADIDTVVARLNTQYSPSGFQFVHETSFHNSKKYRTLATGDVGAMKNSYADSPSTKLNVYVVDTDGSGSWGTFPWTANALSAQGGIVIDDDWMQADTSLPSIFPHEVGHCLGLWHTFHGVDEVTQCGPCYEPAGRVASVGDITGDLCADTEPTLRSQTDCTTPLGLDPCTPNNAWSLTACDNFMGYAHSFANKFTAQQAARMHCWTNDLLSGWLAVSVQPPAAPTGLVANAVSSSRIDLSWTDNSNDEDGFAIERSPGGLAAWTPIATVGADVTSYSNQGLAASTSYDYRVRATNSGGNSGFSNTASATTLPQQPGDTTADQDIPVSGSVGGSHIETQASDGGYEVITEVESGGRKSSRYSYLEHKWAIQAPVGGSTFSFHIEAFRSASSDGDNFVFAWSSDDQQYHDMLTVTKTVDDDQAQTFTFPGSLSGTVYIRVRDTNRTQGNQALDTISIDHMFLRSQ